MPPARFADELPDVVGGGSEGGGLVLTVGPSGRAAAVRTYSGRARMPLLLYLCVICVLGG